MSWKEEWKNNITDVEGLDRYLKLTEDEKTEYRAILEKYPMAIPEYYISLIDPDDPDDPIRKMSVPAVIETDTSGSYDTSGETENTVTQGMQHKYGQTALILSTNACMMYCRHCFRKRLVGLERKEIMQNLDDAVAYIKDHREVNNVLVSGGDSFCNSNDVIREYLEKLTPIEHLDYIRFGTRIPVVFPQRITTDPELLEILQEFQAKKRIYIVTQFNHPNELTPQAIAAVKALQDIGIIIKNQTVLLKGINDDLEVLGTLLKRFTEVGIVPYYIFQCRPVTGVKNQFQVPLNKGYAIVDAAKNMQSGQGKCVKFAMSHVTGKIEIVGQMENGEMIFKYHQAKYEKDRNRIFTKRLADDQCWL